MSAQESLFDAEPPRPVYDHWSEFFSSRAPIKAQLSSEESVDAAVENMPNRAGQRARVLAYLEDHPSTDEQVQEALGMDPNTQRPRRVELAQRGLIKKVGVGRTRSGRRAAVWGKS